MAIDAAPSQPLVSTGVASRGLDRRRFGAMVLAAGAASLLPCRSVLARPASDEARFIDFEWVDTARDRAVPARLYWPPASTRKGPVPLIVFSHGLGGSRKGYNYLGEGWSARGTASLHIQHVGSDESLWQGNPIMLLDRLGGAADEHEAIERTRDVSFGLDRLLQRDSPFQAAIDRRRIVAAGHSFGANTTLILTGAQVIRDGRPLGFQDPRFTASTVISAPPFYGETDLAAVLASVDVPTLHVTTTEDTIRVPGRYSPVRDRIDIYAAIPTPRKALVVFQGGPHKRLHRPLPPERRAAEPSGEAGDRRGRARLPRPCLRVRSRPPRRLECDPEADSGRGTDAVPGRPAAVGQEAAHLGFRSRFLLRLCEVVSRAGGMVRLHREMIEPAGVRA